MADQTPAEELRELIREAHELLKDLRAERKAVEQLLDGIPAKVDGRITAALEVGLKGLSEATKGAIDVATEKVFHRFDTLQAIVTGTNPAARRAGKPPLEDLLHAHAERKANRG